MKIPTEILLFFSITLFLQPSQGLVWPPNCSITPNPSDCQNILSDNSLALSEKKDLYVNLLLANQNPFDFAWQYNTTQTPNVPKQSNGIIQNAWVKLVTIKNSFYDSNSQTTFIPAASQVFSDYGFEIVLPTDTQEGDCQTTYEYSLEQNEFSQQLNNQNLGQSKLVSYSTSQTDNVFKAQLNLLARLITNHYSIVQNCVWMGGFYFCTDQCAFNHADTQDYSLNLTDSIQTKVLQPQINAKAMQGNGQIFASIEADPFWDQLQLNEHNQINAVYDLNLSPADTIVIIRTPTNTVLANRFEIDSTQDPCMASISIGFETDSIPCAAGKRTRIELSTDQNHYDYNEVIHLKIWLLDDQNAGIGQKQVLVQTQEQEYTQMTNDSGEANLEIPANQTNGFIEAVFETDFDYLPSRGVVRFQLIHPENAAQALNVGLFFGAYGVLFVVAKRFAGGF